MMQTEQTAAPVAAPLTEETKAVEDDKREEPKVAAIVEDPEAPNKSSNRDTVLARVANEKRLSLVKAWEDNEKAKAENKSQKQLSEVAAWENSKKAVFEAKLKKIEEQLEKKNAEHAKRMKNEVALVHKQAEEKRALVEARRAEDLLNAEEMAAKYRATGQIPKKGFAFFG